jgi:hypothetical protein
MDGTPEETYEAPTIQVLGTVDEMTQVVGPSSKDDN